MILIVAYKNHIENIVAFHFDDVAGFIDVPQQIRKYSLSAPLQEMLDDSRQAILNYKKEQAEGT